ncbi:malto-oligosyltrehalose synthase [Streptomonospora nanhaiensis]|uniref:(1->4)-alpha-D-glucan 1-alpha-D-glucosylmutase n=1 Tax=Streptomonospora nanhaiensis TaxID=1323731 RepID=A0A853BH33_9ACTN|nr:malto-oligosyltrehalose synthase [Streptomonospora nanhaiensis]MBX9388440.1 malto-oligosyltrehalose synthase [Streptomonospora nanhaiensis]NYI94045.1 (1->4)-alpha-D-glucan 1-alpha-D-glucosylmutase [Streptomonospora nanhaiensis]
MRAKAPTSTYRLQLGPALTLTRAAELVGYLHRLGVDTAYLSPILTAAPGSEHGYDVVDPTEVSPALGGDPARAALVERLRAHGMGVVVDIVPNHMSVAAPAANPWWWDVLRHGRDSAYARCFDIDWSQDVLQLPVLADDGDDGAAALAKLGIADGCLTYEDHRFPLAPGTHRAGDNPADVHARQHYRLVSWRRARTRLDYRRFFDITGLAGVRMEDPDVFTAGHAEILRWAERGELDGLRVDHPDGLADPGAYLRRLRERFPGWIVAEKILEPGEDLPASWPVAGTTGYDALREVCGVFVDPAGEPGLTALADSLGVPTDHAAAKAEGRRMAARELLRPEVVRIAALLDHPEPDRAEDAVAELLASFPAYRSYLPEGRAAWDTALAQARAARPDLADVLAALDARVRAEPEGEPALRVQQTSGMVMAKGTEDTAFYRATRMVALNEVGGDPARFGVPVAEFHAAQARRESAWPHTMTTLSTHDTKRSEDVRARLAVLSEIPEEFAAAVRRWRERRALPDPALDLLAWQTLVGTWPISADRLRDYLLKAAHEQKVRTSWLDPDPEFDAEVAAWPERVLSDDDLCADVAAFVGRVRAAGWSNALGQKLLQLVGPGVPDVYQGTELWDLSLVDPDNRRPVDFTLRECLLERLERGHVPEVDATGEAKLHVVRQALLLRRDGGRDLRGYLPLEPSGPAAAHAVAFARGPERDVAAVATRLPLGLARAGGWRDTVLPLPTGPGTWTDLLTGQVVAPERTDGFCAARLESLLARYPVALLVRRQPSG